MQAVTYSSEWNLTMFCVLKPQDINYLWRNSYSFFMYSCWQNSCSCAFKPLLTEWHICYIWVNIVMGTSLTSYNPTSYMFYCFSGDTAKGIENSHFWKRSFSEHTSTFTQIVTYLLSTLQATTSKQQPLHNITGTTVE